MGWHLVCMYSKRHLFRDFRAKFASRDAAESRRGGIVSISRVLAWWARFLRDLLDRGFVT